MSAITRQDTKRFVQLVRRGLPLAKAALLVGKPTTSLKRAVLRHGLSLTEPFELGGVIVRPAFEIGHDLTWSAISDIPWKEAAARVASMRAV